MPALFANPLGFLGLLAIPAILAIHFLREKSKRISVSTMFLLERMEPRTPTGRRLRNLQNSVPLWLQLLIVVLGTWLLVQPRWIRTDSRQRVTVILDPTASMSVIRSRVQEQLPLILQELSKSAARTDWLALQADQPETPLYRGTDVAELVKSLESWRPALPSTDPSRAFAIALLDSRGGPILFVSDRKPEAIPAGVTLLAFGEEIQNCGFAGARAWRDKAGLHWEALIRNSGTQPQEREWWMETETSQTTRLKINLQPGEIVTLPGFFPGDSKRVTVMLSPDAFTMDDVLPIVAPEPKPLLVAYQAANVPAQFVDRVIATIPGAQRTGDFSVADVILTSADAVQPPPADHAAVIFGGKAGKIPGAGSAITVERHPLTDGALWNGLLSSGAGDVTLSPSEQPLVWQRDQPLVFIRQTSDSPHLVFNFDFARSNADRLPASVLMLSRFLEDAQRRKVAAFAGNFETNQLLPLPRGGRYEVATAERGADRGRMEMTRRAPLEPGFFSVRRDDQTLLTGAAWFGDPREADFREATTTASKLDRAQLIPRENLEEDPFTALWLSIIGTCLVGSWASQSRMLRAS